MKLIGCVADRRPSTLRSRTALAGCLAIVLVSTLGPSSVVLGAGVSVPANLDSHLQRWVEQSELNGTATTPRPFAVPLRTPQMMGVPARFNAQGRVLVQIHLDGTQSMQAVENALRSQQIQILTKNSRYRHGVFAGYLTAAQVEAAAKTAGVHSVRLDGIPHANVGKVTSEGTVVLKTDLVNKEGFKGDGITVGVLSDSFNTALLNVQSPPVTTAADDVASGDLPVVNVLEDFDNNGFGGTDEGRAMCQIVYDLAPHCNLAFATAFQSELDFANNIVLLRTEANCDVIADDVSYSDDPVFSDGILAQAVDLVATSTTIPGHPAVYCSSAGNEGDNGYVSAYRNLSDKAVRAPGAHGNLILNVTNKNAPNYLDPALTAGGWLNWNPNGGSEPSTTITTSVLAPGNPYNLFLQWDDAFDQAHGITTSYNFLVFDAQGNYHPELSGTSDAFSIQEAYQQTASLTLGTTYQLAITRSNKKDPLAPLPPTTPHISITTFLDGIGNLIGKYFHASPLNVQTTYGHPAANGAIGCAAYVYDWTDLKTYIPVIEAYTSPGPVWIYFDENGNRLATPELRAKPEVAGVDGVGTTFFGAPYEHDQFAFFGTSAAAPHVAGVAALLVQIAGGPGSIDPGTIKQLLEATTPPRNLVPLVSTGTGASKSGFITVTGEGSVTDGPNYLTLTYIGPPGQYIESLTINGSKGDLIFDAKAGNPPPTVGKTVGISSSDVTFASNSTASVLTVSFTKGKFVPGCSVSFTVDQDVAATRVSGGQADYLSYGTTYAVQFGPKADSISGPFQFGNGANSNIGTGYNRADGFGLVDALAAADLLQQLLGGQPQSQPTQTTPPSTHPVPLGPVAN